MAIKLILYCQDISRDIPCVVIFEREISCVDIYFHGATPSPKLDSTSHPLASLIAILFRSGFHLASVIDLRY